MSQNVQRGFLKFCRGLSCRDLEVAHSTLVWSKSHNFGVWYKMTTPTIEMDIIFLKAPEVYVLGLSGLFMFTVKARNRGLFQTTSPKKLLSRTKLIHMIFSLSYALPVES